MPHPAPEALEKTISEAHVDVMRKCVFQQHCFVGSSSLPNTPEIVKFGFKLLKSSGYGVLPTDKDGGVCILKRVSR